MLRHLAITLTLAAALTAVSAHAEDRTPTQSSVRVAARDYSDAAHLHFLYARIHAAAHRVCDSDMSDSMTANDDKTCVRDTVSDTVRQLNNPQLSALDGQSPVQMADSAEREGRNADATAQTATR